MNVRTFCLGILALGDATGYEIRKMVSQGPFSFFSEASFGSIYPALAKLTEEGLVECREEAQSKRPDKKIYRLTAAGRAALEAALQDDPVPDRTRSDFLAALLFAECVAPERIPAMVATRIAQHRAQIEALEQIADDPDLSPAARFVISYGLAGLKAARDHLERHADELARELAGARSAAE